MNGLATSIISCLVLVVAYMQWRTNHQKVVLDLFEKRLQVYSAVKQSVGEYLNTSEGNDNAVTQFKMEELRNSARFLFGREVSDHIRNLKEKIARHTYLDRQVGRQSVTQRERDEAAAQLVKIEADLSAMLDPWTEVCLPYLLMDQKRVKTPLDCWRERNAARLSYADEKQR